VTTETKQPRLRISDPRVVRALAHPARLAIIEHLAAGGSATATECAEVSGLSPSATSYHLRALAKAGLIEEAPNRGDARERVWQSRDAGAGFDINAEPAQDPDARRAERDLLTIVLDRQESQARDWMVKAADEPQEWRDATTFLGARLLLTAAELTELTKAVTDLLEPYHLRRRKADPPPGVRRVVVTYRAFPTD
jgi:DNA-binding transcriptional ArsR family regulator